MSADTQESIEEGIKNVPDSVSRYHKWNGAKLSFIHDFLFYDGYQNEVIKGFYYHRSSNIEISTADKWNKTDLYETVVHELGHFLYAKTYMLWTEESKEELTSQFEYWKKYAPGCDDEDEAFAFVYSLYRAYNSPYLDTACKKMVEEAEKICDQLYAMSADGSAVKVGPGTIEQLKGILKQ